MRRWLDVADAGRSEIIREHEEKIAARCEARRRIERDFDLEGQA